MSKEIENKINNILNSVEEKIAKLKCPYCNNILKVGTEDYYDDGYYCDHLIGNDYYFDYLLFQKGDYEFSQNIYLGIENGREVSFCFIFVGHWQITEYNCDNITLKEIELLNNKKTIQEVKEAFDKWIKWRAVK